MLGIKKGIYTVGTHWSLLNIYLSSFLNPLPADLWQQCSPKRVVLNDHLATSSKRCWVFPTIYLVDLDTFHSTFVCLGSSQITCFPLPCIFLIIYLSSSGTSLVHNHSNSHIRNVLIPQNKSLAWPSFLPLYTLSLDDSPAISWHQISLLLPSLYW